tara:strand:- start:444 stop:932 length:489 start_codon:yes stop_codon:yes gene_type:complete
MSESTVISQKNIDKLNKQIEDNFKKAFFDLLNQKVAENPPDYDWITKLYTEIQVKLKKLLKPTNPLYKEIEEHMDIQLFDQMIRNNAFNGVDFYNLINYVFELIKKLGSPARDNLANSKKEEILNIMKNGGTFADIVPIFIKNANECIDFIYTDIQNLLKKK